MSIVWTKDLDTGIDIIDEQHKTIVKFINQLDQEIKQKAPQSVGTVLTELSDYCISHLAFEERLMMEAGYPHAKPHKALHDMFVKRLRKYQEKHRAGENVAKQLHEMLGAWLVHHIKQTDMAYVSDVKKHLGHIDKQDEGEGWLGRSLKMFFG